MASNTIKAQVAASPRAVNPAGFDMTAGTIGFFLGDGAVTPSLCAVQNQAGATLILTLPTPSSCPGRQLFVSTISAHAVVSDSSNVVSLTGSTGTAICAATAGKWAHLISDGATLWRVIGGN